MTTVRISSNWGHPHQMDWCGAPAIDGRSRIARELKLPEEAYEKIEAGIAHGYVEGSVFLEDGSCVKWFLDGPRPGTRTAMPSSQVSSGKDVRDVPFPAVPSATTSPVGEAPKGSDKLLDISGKSSPGMIHPTGDFRSGWVMAEFPVAAPPERTTCPHCGQIMPASEKESDKSHQQK